MGGISCLEGRCSKSELLRGSIGPTVHVVYVKSIRICSLSASQACVPHGYLSLQAAKCVSGQFITTDSDLQSYFHPLRLTPVLL